jgi:serine/threonine protein kinase
MLLSKDNTKPFNHTDFYTMVDLIQEGKVNYDASVWDKSDTAKDFVQHMLRVNPYHRYTIVQALQHPFIQQRDRTIYELPSPKIYKNIECSIQQYSQQDTSVLKKLALSIIAHASISNQKYASPNIDKNISTNNTSYQNTIDQLQKAFTQFDTEKNGVLSFDEFKTAILQTISRDQNEMDDVEAVSSEIPSSLKENESTNASIVTGDTTKNQGDDDDDDNDNHPNRTVPCYGSQVLPFTYTDDELKRIFASLVGSQQL